jgi:ubiquinone/menaquinone biosynthesis C-methylase UbiE
MENIIDKYNKLYCEFGISNRSLGWGEKERSTLRFKILTEHWDLKGKKILDFGCGFGALYEYINKNITSNFKYIGIDINENFIKIAKAKFKDKKCEFLLQDILKKKLPRNYTDYSIISGTFNDYRKNHKNFFEKVIYELNKISKKGIAINFLSSFAEIKYKHASYFNPNYILRKAFEISKNIILRYDYMPYEFSIVINKDIPIDYNMVIYDNFKYFTKNENPF